MASGKDKARVHYQNAADFGDEARALASKRKCSPALNHYGIAAKYLGTADGYVLNSDVKSHPARQPALASLARAEAQIIKRCMRGR